ncbi:hybrid sensor histidine kinase/response regulator transcription factor [Spirosoma pollinicola]|nr:ATP-binding protein [Spirosoma pollinicola]
MNARPIGFYARALRLFFGTFPVWLALSMPVTQAQPTSLLLTADSLQKGLAGYFLYPMPWRFQAGDNPTWANPALDDHAWQRAKTGNNVGNTPPGWKGVGWFRLHFTLDKPLLGQMMALKINHMGASDIYLDGQRIGGFGQVGHSRATETSYIPNNEPVAFRLDQPGDHVLAVRVSTFHRYLTRKVRYGQGFLSWIAPHDRLAQYTLNMARNNSLNLVLVFGTGLFALLHLFLYLFYPVRVSNLYYSLSLAFFTGASACVYVDNILTNPATLQLICYLMVGLNQAYSVLTVAFIYSICYVSQPRQVWAFCSIGVLLYGIFLVFPTLAMEWVLITFASGCVGEVLRVVWQGIYRKQPGIWLIGVGILAVAVVYGVAAGNGDVLGLWPNNPSGQSWFIAFGLLTLPLCTSLYLAQDFARTNGSLAAQLNQVNALSQKTLAQEAEKLKLVAEQNEVLEQTVQERTEKIQQQANKLREIDAIKSRFFTNLTHEFRTPLTLMLGPAEQVLAETEEPKTKQQVGLLYRNAQRLLQLINQLLDLSKLEAGKTQLTPTSVDLVGLVKGTLLSFESLAHQKQIALHVTASLDQLMMDMDRDKIEKILYNLFSNAIKFTPAGGEVSIGLTDEGVRVEEPWATLVVHDTGVGIPAANLPYVFDQFYQVDASITREQEGFGIGLALTKELVELHGGRIHIDSQQGIGTIVTVRLPIRQEHPIRDGVEHSLPTSYRGVTDPVEDPLPQSSGGADAQLLLIEDNDEVRQFIRSSLGHQYRIIEAINGEEGVRLAQEHVPDLVITDLMMPKLDGYQVCAALKQDERTSHIPIVMLTAKADLDSRIEGLQTGADSYLAKPFHQRELMAQIANLITSRRQLRERFNRDSLWHTGDALPSMEQAFLDRVRTAIDAHLEDEGFSVDQLSDNLGVSRTQLHRKLKALINQSPGDLIRVVRLQRALDLLTRNVATVSEVAYMVGFGNPANFSTSFSRHFGYAPSEVKKKVGSAAS